jgi:[acyl-carrier-protein] S-malonyltransferase
MGRALFETSASARQIFERADRALGFELSRLCFEGPEADLVRTENAQPAIVTTSIALLEALREAHPSLPEPNFAAGHSLGEYSALVAAGALSLEDAVRTVRARGKAMQLAVPEGTGAMAAIMGASLEEVSDLCAKAGQGDVLSAANFNAPGQTVIAGAKAAVDRALELAKARKLKAIGLKVSAPFHCQLMAPAARVVADELARVSLAPLRFPVIANVDAQPNASQDRIADLLVQQVDSPVRWQQSVEYAVQAGATQALEIGPGKVLAGLVKRIDARLRVFNVHDVESVQLAGAFLAS